MNKDSKYLITGGSGFLGHALIGHMLKEGYKNITTLARNEGELIKLKEKYHDVEIITGDISDLFVCQKACKDKSGGIFHLGAYKHVSLAEQNVWQCVQSNIIGTINLLNESLAVQPELFMFISTDKASNVKGTYGATKFICERLIDEASEVNTDTKYRVVRYGNVWGSTGSFITKWKPLIEQGKEIVLTDPNATRFFFTVEDAVNLIFNCIENGQDAKPFIPNMKSVSMGIILEACQDIYGKCPVKIIGLQQGENLHETMDGVTFSNQVEHYTKDDFIKEFLCPMTS